MDQSRVAQAMTSLSAALVGPDDALSRATELLDQCREVLAADASAILVLAGDELELFVASSHAAAQLELHQTRCAEGPCEDAIAAPKPVQASGRDEVQRRWPAFAPAMLDTGFVSVRAAPLIWHDTTLGVLVLYYREAVEQNSAEGDMLGAFADIASIMLLQSRDLSAADITARLRRALSARALLEQAKGVIAETDGCDMEAAHGRVLDQVEATGMSVTATAAAIVAAAVGGASA